MKVSVVRFDRSRAVVLDAGLRPTMITVSVMQDDGVEHEFVLPVRYLPDGTAVVAVSDLEVED